MIKKDGSNEEAGKNLKVFYLKDGRRRQLDLQNLFRAELFFGLVGSGLCHPLLLRSPLSKSTISLVWAGRVGELRTSELLGALQTTGARI